MIIRCTLVVLGLLLFQQSGPPQETGQHCSNAAKASEAARCSKCSHATKCGKDQKEGDDPECKSNCNMKRCDCKGPCMTRMSHVGTNVASVTQHCVK